MHKFVCTISHDACSFIYFLNEFGAEQVQSYLVLVLSECIVVPPPSNMSAAARAQTMLPEPRRPFEASVKASLHSTGPSMLLALYHDCSPAGECVAIDQQLVRFAQPLIRWREREGSSSKQEKRGWGVEEGGEGGVRFTQAVSEPPLSVEGANERSWGGGGSRRRGEVVVVGWRRVGAGGLPNKRRHLQQLSQLTGKLWRRANVG